MRISDTDDDSFFGEGVEPPDEMNELFRPEISNWRFAIVDPEVRMLRSDAPEAIVPVPHLRTIPKRHAAAIDDFNESLYFG
ncbi:MAG: hypothetical protein R3C19_08370 [Planctomycetaceae bacterium]